MDVTWSLAFGKLEIVVIAVIFLQSLLVAWFLFLIAGAFDQTIPLFRLMMGAAILFAILVPVFILLEGFRYISIMAAFFMPLLLYALMFPLFNSLISHINLFFSPVIIIPAIIGGIGFGLIGLGAYHLRGGRKDICAGDCRSDDHLPQFPDGPCGFPVRSHGRPHVDPRVPGLIFLPFFLQV